jgi:hypothetical protein
MTHPRWKIRCILLDTDLINIDVHMVLLNLMVI